MIPEQRIHEMWDEEYRKAIFHYSYIRDCITFELMGGVGRIGVCKYPNRETAHIGISVLITSEDVMRMIMRHELAHAIEWLTYYRRGHGVTWRRACFKLGGDGERCHNGEGVVKPKPSVIIKCPCGWKMTRQRITRMVREVEGKTDKYSCPRCSTKDSQFTVEYPLKNQPVVGVPLDASTAYSYEIKKRPRKNNEL